jgi:glyoxylase-like metal-dependent hydrolase (beta-lactamase superfamily II)
VTASVADGLLIDWSSPPELDGSADPKIRHVERFLLSPNVPDFPLAFRYGNGNTAIRLYCYRLPICKNMRPIVRIAPDVGWLSISFVNVYFIGRPGGAWVLVDAGLPGFSREIIDAAEARFGAGARPEAIILTHGHFDHAGSALALAEYWGVPIHAHSLEMPYLNGRSPYPPPDPTIGGAMAFLSRFLPSRGIDLGDRVRELKPNEFPGIPGWEWMRTPGHSPGHISLFRSSDRVLLAGDAFATMNMDSWTGLITGRRVLACHHVRFQIRQLFDRRTRRADVRRRSADRASKVGR